MRFLHSRCFRNSAAKIAVFLVGLAAGSGSAAAESVSWTGGWEAPDLPQAAVPPWTYLGSAGSGVVTQTEALNIVSDALESSACFVQDSGAGHWTITSAGATVEAELRVNRREGEFAGAITLSGFGPDRKKAYVLYAGDGWVQLGQNAANRIPCEPGEFVRVRVTANDGEARVFVGDHVPLVLPQEEALDADGAKLVFGDPSGHGGGDVDWKSLKWTDAGAFAP